MLAWRRDYRLLILLKKPERKVKDGTDLTTGARTHQAVKLPVELVDCVRDQKAEVKAITKVLSEIRLKFNATLSWDHMQISGRKCNGSPCEVPGLHSLPPYPSERETANQSRTGV